MVGSTETRSPSWGTLASLQEVSTCTLYSASIMCHLVENSEYVHVYSSCSAQKGQHEPYKGECCSCLGTATNLLDIYVINHNHCHSYSVSGRFEGRGKIAMTFEPMQRKLPELKLTRVQRSQIGLLRARGGSGLGTRLLRQLLRVLAPPVAVALRHRRRHARPRHHVRALSAARTRRGY